MTSSSNGDCTFKGLVQNESTSIPVVTRCRVLSVGMRKSEFNTM